MLAVICIALSKSVKMYKPSTFRNLNLDCARGVASLLVLAGHLRAFVFVDYSNLASTGWISKLFYMLTGLGHQSVMIFFVLSGFLITQSIQSSVMQGQWSWRTYGINRLIRLWVVLIPTLLLTLFWDSLGKTLTGSSYYSGLMYTMYNSGPQVGVTEASYHLATFLQNIFFLQTITAPTYGTNGPLWSLANEFWYYVIFPLAYLLFVKATTLTHRLLLLIILTAIVMWLPFDLLLLGGVWLLGYLAVLIYKQPFIQWLCGNFWYLACTVLIFMVTIGASRVGRLAGLWGDGAVGFTFFLVMLGLLHYEINHSLYRNISAFFSRISYTLYLTHFPFLSFLICVLLKNQRYPFNAIGMLLYSGLLIASIIYAYIMYRLFEHNTPKVRNFLVTYIAAKKVSHGLKSETI